MSLRLISSRLSLSLGIKSYGTVTHSSLSTNLHRPYIIHTTYQLSTIRHYTSENTSSTLLQHSELIETSANARWVEDAAVVAQELADLPPQGDLTSLGLGGYGPVGLIQTSIEWIHLHTGLPWWGSIIVSSLILRSLLFPLAIKLQANAARLNNIRPETDRIMAKLKEYQQSGNTNMAAYESTRLMKLYNDHKCNPLKMMIMPFVQFPIFISFFVALRQMASAPVESMKHGGALWFTDLTLPDPYYVLPFTSCFAFIANIELGGEAGVTNPQVEKMKMFFRAMAILLVPVTATFPSGLFMYWLTSSVFSMGQILILKVPSVRRRLGIPVLIKHPPEATAAGTSGSGFMGQFKKNYNQASLISEAKSKVESAKRTYNKQLADKSPKLFDKPPHKRNDS